MSEQIPVSSFEKRVAAEEEILSKLPSGVVIEYAATSPGGGLDFQFAPVDPARHAAAQRLVAKAGLQNEVVALIGR